MEKNNGANNDGNWRAGVIPPFGMYGSNEQMRPGGSAMGQGVAYPPQFPPSRSNQGPVGLQALCTACTRVYPNQPNPLQVTAKVKYWLGGPDPLDYVSMYWNNGNPELNIPPHWHYISFGLSDLHGDGRVHPPPPLGALPPDHVSGLGFELSFRLLNDQPQPPTWPAALLQRLANYIFNTGNRLCVGDYVSWHYALDGSDENAHIRINKMNTMNDINRSRHKCKIRHMLIAQDPQLAFIDTPLGKVQFVQIVGITDKELKAAQRSGGSVILESLSHDRIVGPWFITNMNRRQSASIMNDQHNPSDLSGVSAVCRWEYWNPNILDDTDKQGHGSASELSQSVKQQIKCILQKGLSEISIQSSKDKKNDKAKSETGEKETAEVKTDCKMSTDSVKFPTVDFEDQNLPIPEVVNAEETTMVTNSFEMSKIAAALLEETKEPPIDAPSVDAVKTEQNVDIKNNNLSDETSFAPSEANMLNLLSSNYCNAPPNITQDGISLHGVHLIFNQEAGNLLPLALRCRIMHGRHFTWKSVGEVQAITFVSSNVTGAFVTQEHPIVAYNGWLQVLIPNDFAMEMSNDLDVLMEDDDNEDSDEESQNNYPHPRNPSTFFWPHRGLKITINFNTGI